jgi:hypothetical protein
MAVAAIAATARPATATVCAALGGDVVGFTPTTHDSCGTDFGVSLNLFRAETIGTASVGQITFHTPSLYECRELAGSSDVVAPRAGIALEHVTGVTWCRHRAQDGKTWLTAKKQKIRANGTLIGLATTAAGTTVEVADGSATVLPDGSGPPITVPPDHQVLLPNVGPPGRVTALALKVPEAIVVTELRLGVVESVLAPVETALTATAQHSVLIVGQDAESAKQLAARMGDFGKTSFTAAQVQREPSLVSAQLTKLGAQTVVTTGDPKTLTPAWQALRAQAPSAAIYVVPPSPAH